MKIFLHDRIVDEEEAKVSVFDHGLLYGDGIFEGIRIYDGCIFRLRQHLERLYSSARYLFLTVPMDIDEIKRAVVETVRANKVRTGYIRLVVTRGVGPLGLLPDLCKKAATIIIVSSVQLFPPESRERGLRLWTSPTRRANSEVLNPRVKSLNYLNNILAKVEARKAGHDEALLLDGHGVVTECSGMNIFVAKEGVLSTPPVSCGALRGITRDFVMELAQEFGHEVREEPFTRFEVIDADEVFLTGTAAEIVGAVALDGRIIGSGKPGPITLMLSEVFRKRVAGDGVQVYDGGEAVLSV